MEITPCAGRLFYLGFFRAGCVIKQVRLAVEKTATIAVRVESALAPIVIVGSGPVGIRIAQELLRLNP